MSDDASQSSSTGNSISESDVQCTLRFPRMNEAAKEDLCNGFVQSQTANSDLAILRRASLEGCARAINTSDYQNICNETPEDCDQQLASACLTVDSRIQASSMAPLRFNPTPHAAYLDLVQLTAFAVDYTLRLKWGLVHGSDLIDYPQLESGVAYAETVILIILGEKQALLGGFGNFCERSEALSTVTADFADTNNVTFMLWSMCAEMAFRVGTTVDDQSFTLRQVLLNLKPEDRLRLVELLTHLWAANVYGERAISDHLEKQLRRVRAEISLETRHPPRSQPAITRNAERDSVVLRIWMAWQALIEMPNITSILDSIGHQGTRFIPWMPGQQKHAQKAN